MALPGRSCSTALTKSLVLLLLQAVIIAGNYAEETITCSSGGYCVPAYLCNGNGTVITDGDGLIDTRNGADECPRGLVCCREEDSNEICGGTCVPEGACEAGGINLRVGGAGGGCSFGEICCDLPLNRCRGTCTTVDLCGDNGRVDLRFEDQLCPGSQVCCEKSKTNAICRGRCVAANECSRSSNLVDLRVQSNDGCPGDRICCQNTCEGQCVPRGQCGDDTKDIDLRVGDSSCPENQVCCKNPRTCTCVDPSKCPQMINLRFSSECPFHQVCCDSVSDSNCQGLCTPDDQCKVRSNGTCSGGLTCCGKIKPSCDGSCVSLGQCPTGAVDLRLSSDGSCPTNQVCCRNASKLCNGSCVSQEQCADSGFDLRISSQTCPGNAVCCKNLSKSPTGKVCQGRCVPSQQCTGQSQNSVDLRFSEGLCPMNLVCCPASTSCSGSCVAGNRCLDTTLSINLRSGTGSCPAGLVCCQNVNKGSTCDGQCTSRDRCADLTLGINLRLSDQSCPSNQICCKNVRKPLPDAECTCVTLDQCADDQRSIDLRTGGQKCPSRKICCTKLKTTIEKCDGSCVSYQDCPEIANASSVDLRLFSGGCPANQVCCKSRCDGVCVPFGQCSDGSLGINLRNEDGGCPRSMQCCKNPSNTAKSSCEGKCLPREQCPFINLIDLRVGEEGCPNQQVCCNLQQDPFAVPTLDGPNQAPKQDQSSSEEPQCDLKIDPTSSTLTKIDVPWLVTVWTRREYLGVQRNQYECSGTLLAPDLILTSADCVSELMDVEHVYVRVGDFNLKPIETLSRRREYRVSKIDTHPDYDGRSNYANVATLRLAKNSTSKSSTCLAQTSDDRPNSSCFLIGWSKRDLANDSVPNALPVKIPLHSTVEGCSQGLICSERASAVDQCDDFQGSSLICESDQRWKQVGIATRTQCGDLGVPESFTALSLHWSWIQEQISPSFVQVMKPTEPSRFYLPAKV
ncbi:balbiani ring protein 3-like [Culex pipiens pallens]|uniref:balbiani ring protein 3-like n=1 Tax=Culex pipiens pallens TaxID=42434 RepID=UPI0019539CC6|nr:balbiani ring protein 3-like [Culex pipiens pallens]